MARASGPRTSRRAACVPAVEMREKGTPAAGLLVRRRPSHGHQFNFTFAPPTPFSTSMR